METEIEAKFLDVDINNLRKRLKVLNAKRVHSEVLMKRKAFDYADNRLMKIGGWIRGRDEGDRITLSYKQLNDRTLHGTKEISLDVDDFDNACQLLLSIGLKQKAYQETKREKWILDGNEVTIDTWPWIPSFVEIESNDEESLKKIAKKLGFKWEETMHGSVETVYQRHFDVTEEEVDKWKSIIFIDIPNWLEKKRKQEIQEIKG